MFVNCSCSYSLRGEFPVFSNEIIDNFAVNNILSLLIFEDILGCINSHYSKYIENEYTDTD